MPIRRNPLYSVIILVFLAAAIVVTYILISDDVDKIRSTVQLTDPVLIEGKRLSEVYCASCHSYPEPDLLPASTWMTETLPAMGPFMGIYEHKGEYYNYPANPSQTRYLPPDYYPSEQMLSNEEWQKILEYYEYASPEILTPAPRQPEIISDSLLFKPQFPVDETDQLPQVTVVKFDQKKKLVYSSDSNGFYVYNNELELINFFDLESPVTDIRLLDNDEDLNVRNMLLTHIGNLYPSDQSLGIVSQGLYNHDTGSAELKSHIYKDNLTRPVESQLADLTGNGINDLLISEFGHRTGRLSWFEIDGESLHSEQHVLIETPGCIQAHILDITNNGLNDILALCSQLDQSIYLFRNYGQGNFEKETLLQFKITAGSSSFQVTDMNGNGYPDILYTSGDNADYSKVYKPYHGVYIYINDGNLNFTQEWFYPINGAYHVIARDFNKNGLPDLAVISYFADYIRSPEEGFIFFKNSGGFQFTPYHHPATQIGRWITMDVADWTGNGFDDIILGNSPHGPDPGADPFRQNWNHNYQFMILVNQMN
jgi:hypothetical protein